MENQHKHIKGYRDLSAEEIALMNRIKEKGEELERLVNDVKGHINRQQFAAHTRVDLAEEERLAKAQPQRWAQVGCTHLQEGLMALTRAVAQPSSF